MAKYDFDLFIIGAGSGGVRAARLASKLGKKVAIAEEYRFGGTCVIRGCVPKKLMVFASSYSKIFKEGKGYGWDQKNASFSWNKFSKSMNFEIDRLEEIYRDLLISSNVKVFRQKAKLYSSNSVILNDKTKITAKYILIATGGDPQKLEIEGGNLSISSNDIFNLPSLPKKMIIIGGGYIACEFASIFNGLGVEVTLIYRGKNLLRGFDYDIQRLVRQGLEEKGIKILVNTVIEGVTKCSKTLTVALSNNRQLVVNEVICATGRKPNIENLGLEELGVDLKGGAVLVDKYQRTNISNVYAIGDVTDRLNLTPVAIRDGIAFVDTLFNNKPTVPDHHLVPKAVFTKPEVGTVGMSEIEVANAGIAFVVFKTEFKPMKNQLSGNPQKTLMKMIV